MMFEIFGRGPSYPLGQACRVFGNPEIVSWLHGNPLSEDPAIVQQRAALQLQLERELGVAIRKEMLVATGLRRPLTPKSRREDISPDIWDLLEIDFAAAKARLEAIELVRIEVHEHPKTRFLGRSVFSDRRPEGRKNAAEDPVAVSLSDDLELLTIGQDRMRLRGEIQQHIVKQLVDAWAKGHDLEAKAVLMEAGSNADSIAKAFTGSPNWDRLRQHLALANGRCRIVPRLLATTNDDTVE